jgi:hypothetical protein
MFGIIGVLVTVAFHFCDVRALAPAPFVGRTQHEYTTSLRAAAREDPEVKLDILQPFLPAVDPMYSVRGAVGESEFVLSRSGGPTKDELSNENLYKILMIECSDLEVSIAFLVDSCMMVTHAAYTCPGQHVGVEMFRIPF